MFTFGIFVLVLQYVATAGAQGVGTASCADTGLDWYTKAVGETPCKTYERLRQICNSNYQVGKLSTQTPPDTCSEQVADCCCNNIAFSLSMLCLNCQNKIGTGSGFDAGTGAYQIYLNGGRASGFCAPNTNQTLTKGIQSAVCNNNIKIFDDIYGIFWSDGPWFYTFSSQTMTKDYSSLGEKAFTHCNYTSTTSGTATSTSTSSSQSSSGTATQAADSQTSRKSSIGAGAIAGIVVGIVAAIVAAALIAFCVRKRQKKEPDSEKSKSSPVEPYPYTNVAASDFGSSPPSQYAASEAAPSTYPSTRYFHNPYPSTDASQSMSGLSDGRAQSAAAAGQSVANSGVTSSGSASQGAERRSSISKTAGPTPATYGARSQSFGSPSQHDGNVSPSYSQDFGGASNSGGGSERHVDAGPVDDSSLMRRPSGRLPPAYTDLIRS